MKQGHMRQMAKKKQNGKLKNGNMNEPAENNKPEYQDTE